MGGPPSLLPQVVIALPASRGATFRMAAPFDQDRDEGLEGGTGRGPVNVPFLLPLTKYLPSRSPPTDRPTIHAQ